MAMMFVSGLDSVLTDLKNTAENIPQLRDEILEAQADIVEPAVRGSIANEHLVRSGRLYGSVSREKTKWKGNPAIRIGLRGEHHRYLPSPGKDGIVTNRYVAYVGEYGIPSRGIRARHFMLKAVKASEEKAHRAAVSVHDQYMKKYNL